MEQQWRDRRSLHRCVKFRVVACILLCSAVSPVLKRNAYKHARGGGADHDDIGTQTPRTISPQEPFYSVFTVLTVLKPTHRRTQHTRVNIFEQPLPHITQNSLVICVLPKYTKISTPPQRQLRFSTFTGTVNTVAGTTTTTTAASMIAATTPTHSDNM